MVKLNHHFTKLGKQYLFSEIEKRIALHMTPRKQTSLLNLGIGDVTHPLSPSIAEALVEASKEMGRQETFKGYGPAEGYLFLRKLIAEHDYQNLNISPDEIFISDGAQNDLGNLQEIFSVEQTKIAILDPTYPGYLDTNIIAGRTKGVLKNGKYGGITYLNCEEKNDFQPAFPSSHVDLIYLCSPNNPTGTALTYSMLKQWVDIAKKYDAIIILDGAYEAYVRDANIPQSIFEIEGAKQVAIEVRSFSKTAGFTGLRCSYTVIPKELMAKDLGGNHSLNSLWKRRQETKFGGVCYPVQKAAAATYTPQGKQEIRKMIDSYLSAANILKTGFKNLNITAYGGVNSPYVWCKTPQNMSSWEYFDFLLQNAHIVTVPGQGFGSCGEGFIRFSAFAGAQVAKEAIERIAQCVS